MDFSTVPSSLRSLRRRQPPLPPGVLTVAEDLLSSLDESSSPSSSSSNHQSPKYRENVLRLIEWTDDDSATTKEEKKKKTRWEPLAVGLRCATDLLDDRTAHLEGKRSAADAAAEKKEQGVYAEGPRVPALTPATTTTTSNEVAAAAPSAKAKTDQPTTTAANDDDDDDEASSASWLHFCATLLESCIANLEHDEPRVRSLVAKTVGSHARHSAAASAAAAASATSSASMRKMAYANQLRSQRQTLYAALLSSLHHHVSSGPVKSGQSTDSTGALDDTTGWRALETDLIALASYVDGLKGLYLDEAWDAEFAFDDDDDVEKETGGGDDEKKEKGDGEGQLLEAFEHCAVKHVNRHVRAASVAVLETLVDACASPSGSQARSERMKLLQDDESPLRAVLVTVLQTTLADNWSQVRMAGSVLNRKFWLALLQNDEQGDVPKDEEEEEEDPLESLYTALLPRMCLNRFYLAQGVKLYSHDTWRMIFGGGATASPGDEDTMTTERHGGSGGSGSGTSKRSGMEAVSRCAGPVCRYYVKMCDADNHVVREAACQAVAELASKLGCHPEYAESLAPFVPSLLQALLMCFHDESWPVRDEACLACGTFCRAYPEECRPELKTLFPRWTEHLTDQIWSVREDAAVALGDAIEAYGPDMLAKVLDVAREKLPGARDQPAMTREEYKRRQNDIDGHTDSQLYSCGSLAPKLRKGGAGRIGCSSCDVARPKAPWESTDGCIYLLRELCLRCCAEGEAGASATERGIALDDSVLLPLLTELVDVCRVRHFPQSDDLRATLWRQLPEMARALGKRRFKRTYLQLFLDLLMRNLDDRSGDGASQLSVHAAGQCAEELSNLVGKSIFRGRLEEEWQRDVLDRTLEERARMGNGGPSAAPGMGAAGPSEGFSPFGPPGMFPSGGGAGVGVPTRGSTAAGSPGSFHPGGVAGATTFAAGHPAKPMQPPVPGSGFVDEL